MENLKKALEITKVSRKAFRNVLDNYSLTQLNKVPDGFKNNLFWNIAHVVVTQQLLVYKLSGLDIMVSDQWVELYKKGTCTSKDATKQDLEELKVLLISTMDKTYKDIEANLFKAYTEYPTSTGFVLNSVEDAFEFNNFNEGIHLGYVLALKKAV